MFKLTRLFAAAFFCVCATPSLAEISSAYSKLDFDKGCEWEKPESVEEESLGGQAVCKGLNENYPIYFAEYDLRQIVNFGLAPKDQQLGITFGEFNQVNETVEWRLRGSRPFAAIQRWYIHQGGDTDAQVKSRQGQVLLVSKVADHRLPEKMRWTCTVALVDARSNPNANKMARSLADSLAPEFDCDRDKPKFHGIRGKSSGTPTGVTD